jgi:hypothetical protein
MSDTTAPNKALKLYFLPLAIPSFRNLSHLLQMYSIVIMDYNINPLCSIWLSRKHNEHNRYSYLLILRTFGFPVFVAQVVGHVHDTQGYPSETILSEFTHPEIVLWELTIIHAITTMVAFNHKTWLQNLAWTVASYPPEVTNGMQALKDWSFTLESFRDSDGIAEWHRKVTQSLVRTGLFEDQDEIRAAADTFARWLEVGPLNLMLYAKGMEDKDDSVDLSVFYNALEEED